MVAGCGEHAAAPTGQAPTHLRVAVYPAGSTLPVQAALTQGFFEQNGRKSS
jgi:ABC-type nitrate/sulfonate/bicarbonate transport system substrate-binding protein